MGSVERVPLGSEPRNVIMPAASFTSHSRGVDRSAETVEFRVPTSRGGGVERGDASFTTVVVEQNKKDCAAGIGTNRDPTARWVWDTSPRMCEYLCHGMNPERLVRGKRVLEIGAGAGLPGLVCSRLGAESVTLTDLPQELKLLERNAQINAMKSDAPVDVRACAWGELDDWRQTNGEHETFDLVLVSDVLYHQPKEVLHALAETIKALVSNQGIVLFGYYFRENLVADMVLFDFIDSSFNERSRVSFEDDPNVWLYEWTPKSAHL